MSNKTPTTSHNLSYVSWGLTNWEAFGLNWAWSIVRSIYEEIDGFQKHEELEHRLQWGNIPHLCSSTKCDKVVRELRKEKRFSELAYLYEIMGIMDRNLSLIKRETPSTAFSVSYENTSYINFSCLYYQLVEKAEYASLLARGNLGHHLVQMEYIRLGKKEFIETQLKYIEDNEDPGIKRQGLEEMLKAEEALNIELLGDVCLFFDHDKARYYYQKASDIFRTIDITTQMGETCDYTFSTTSNEFNLNMAACFGQSLFMADDGCERIEEKKILFKLIYEF